MIPADPSRRRFIGTTGLVVGGLLLPAGCSATPLGEAGSPAAIGRGRVLLARGDGVGREPGGPVDGALMRRWLDEMLVRLTGGGSGADAWSALFPRNSRVGIKLNCLAGPRLAPRRELVQAIIAGLRSAGVSARQITVWERSDRELARCGYAIATSGDEPRVYGTDSRAAGYERRIRSNGSIGSCFSRILTEQCDQLINVGVLKDHDLAGVSAGMKNLYGAIHNPNKYHDNACDPYVADLAAHPVVRERLALTVCDGLTAQCQGGPAFVPGWAWNYGGLLVARDPVALDRVAADIVDRRRAVKGLPSLAEAERGPAWIDTAGKLGLGEPELSKIKVTEVG
jgi:uncharacterized protein (DUF362 family)